MQKRWPTLSLPLHTTTDDGRKKRMIFRPPFEASVIVKSEMPFLSAANWRSSYFIFHAAPRKPPLHSLLFFHGRHNSLQFLSWKWGSHCHLTPHDGSTTRAPPILEKNSLAEPDVLNQQNCRVPTLLYIAESLAERWNYPRRRRW